MPAYAEARHDINGIDTAVLTAGEGAPIVVLHGGGTAPGFDELLPLADGARLILPIHPGFGASADDPSIDCVQDYVMHYLDLLDRLGLDEISLVGHSLGGCFAATIALQQPDRVKRLVLMAPWGLHVPEHPTVDFFSIPEEQVLAYLYSDVTKFDGLPPPPAEFLAERAREAESLTRVTGQRPYDAKLHKWLHRISSPTLILWGEADRLIPVGQAAFWAGLIRGSEARTSPRAPPALQRVAGRGHGHRRVHGRRPDAAPSRYARLRVGWLPLDRLVRGCNRGSSGRSASLPGISAPRAQRRA
jgi:pimeloyl-ACP methyl ester carboxylesterase